MNPDPAPLTHFNLERTRQTQVFQSFDLYSWSPSSTTSTTNSLCLPLAHRPLSTGSFSFITWSFRRSYFLHVVDFLPSSRLSGFSTTTPETGHSQEESPQPLPSQSCLTRTAQRIVTVTLNSHRRCSLPPIETTSRPSHTIQACGPDKNLSAPSHETASA